MTGPRKAMTFASANVTDVDHLVNDPLIILEQKFDGTRSMCVIKVNNFELGRRPDLTIEFLSRNGEALKHTAATQWLDPIKDAFTAHIGYLLNSGQLMVGDELVLDGEIMIDTGHYILFDLPFETGEINPEDHYFDRRMQLQLLFGQMNGLVSVGSMAQTPEAKRALYEKVMATNGEGVMAKNRMSPFVEGKRVKHSLKIKFYRTADVVVMDWHRGRDGKDKHGNPTGSETGWIKFGVYGDDGELTSIGNCSIIGKPAVTNDCVIEVKYLYRGANGGLVQPTMMRVREDREPRSCTLEQFAVYSKAIL